MATPRKLRSQGPAEEIDIDHPHGEPDHEDGILDIEYQMVQYGAYHHTFGNRLVHHICIPMICWSTLLLTAGLKLPGFPLVVLARGLAFQPSVALGLAIFYQVFYFILEPIAAFLFLGLCTLEYLTATYYHAFPAAWFPGQKMFYPTAMPLAWGLFIFSWVAQFAGHGFIEKRKPRLVDNLFQALIAAPFFVFMELLFMAGYRPELARKVERRVGAKVRAMNRKMD